MLRDEDSTKKQGNRKLVATSRVSSSIKSRSYESATVLSPQFVPGYYDVICDRKRAARHHSGNVRFKSSSNKFQWRTVMLILNRKEQPS